MKAQELIFDDGFEKCLPGETRVWDGGGDNVSWSVPANWQGNAAPANGDSVSLPVINPQKIVYDISSGTLGIRCLDSNRALSVTGGNLEILKSGNVNSSITVTGGSVKVTTGRLRVVVQ